MRAERVEERAESVLTARELHEADAEGRSARGFPWDEYGLDAQDYVLKRIFDVAFSLFGLITRRCSDKDPETRKVSY